MLKESSFSEEELGCIEEALTSPLWGFAQFTDYFCRDDSSGSYFSENEDDYMYDRLTRYDEDGGRTMYEYLFDSWVKEGKPQYSIVADAPYWASYYIGGRGAKYSSVSYEITIDGGSPIFFWRHGWIPLAWGARMHYARQPNHTLLGGYGCSKTTHVGMSGFVHCATIPRFKFACIAAVGSQSKPMYEAIISAVEGTKAEKFFAHSRSNEPRYSERPNPNIHFYNGSQMLFLGADKDLGKIRSYEGDWTVVEQAESHTSLAEVNRELGSRRRGRVRGRKRMGRMTYVANSGESPELWDRFELAEENQQRYFSFAMSSYDNPHLSSDDITNLEDACGNDDDEIDQYMRGMKPVGKYKDFPRTTVLSCQSDVLDQQLRATMDMGSQEDIRKGVGHILWSLAPRNNADYAVYGDPGTGDPPERGAGVVIVLDETRFPELPADLVHFHWVAGGGLIGPWIDAFQDAMIRYSAQGRSYFEGTGEQKNMDETVFQDRQLIVEPINMSGGLKHGMKIKLLRIMERHLIRWPKSVSGIRIQLSKYDEQLDKMSSKLQQDIVTTLFIAASKLGDRMLESGDIDRREGLLRKSVRGAGGNRKARQVTSRARR